MVGIKLRYKKGGGWASYYNKLAQGGIRIARIKRESQTAIAKEAAKMIRKGLRTGGPPGASFSPLKTTTLIGRVGTRPLREEGRLERSITVVEQGNQSFVGVKSNAVSRSGASMALVAAVHEFGSKPYIIRVTDGIRKLFFYYSIETNGLIRPLSPDTDEIFHPGVPARPFIRPVYDKLFQGGKGNAIIQRVLRNSGGIF